MSAIEVLPAAPPLDALAETARVEHLLVLQAGASMVDHAITAGEALLAAKMQVPKGAWGNWLRENFEPSDWTAKTYMRLAQHKDEVRANLEAPTLTEAITHLRGLPTTRRRNYVSEATKQEALSLRAEGESIRTVASKLGVSRQAVRDWTDPAYYQSRRKKQASKQRRGRVALRAQERERSIRKIGGPVAESYALIRRTAQALDRAHSTSEDREVRRALSSALAKLHEVEDEIVKAVGLT